MRPQTYRVKLTEAERGEVLLITRQGRHPAPVIRRANVLLLSDEGAPDCEVAAALHLAQSTAQRIRRRFSEGGLERALYDGARPGAAPKLDGKQQAFLVALACAEVPEGRRCWTMQMLADTLMELEVVDTISDETVRLALKKSRSSRG
jgi:transposase